MGRSPSRDFAVGLFVFAGLVPWTFFAQALGGASNSLVGNARLINKIYFPRLVMPIAASLAGVVDFVLAFIVLLLMMLFYGIVPTRNAVWLPLLLLLALITSLGVGFWLSAMNVQFRDVRYIVPFLTQLWMFATPIAYPSSIVPEPWRTLSAINPMVGVVEGFRWALLDTDTAPGPMVVVSAAAALMLFVGGAFYFRRMEKTFADVV